MHELRHMQWAHVLGAVRVVCPAGHARGWWHRARHGAVCGITLRVGVMVRARDMQLLLRARTCVSALMCVCVRASLAPLSLSLCLCACAEAVLRCV